MGFIEDMEEIISATNQERQTLLFSATFSKEVVSLAEKFLREDYGVVKIKPEEPTLKAIRQKFYQIPERGLKDKLIKILQSSPNNKTIIFTHTKREAQELATELKGLGFKVEALHGDYSQKRRESVLKNFRQGSFHILVATDIASRGLDIKDERI
ncbi:MAG: helicase-related protein [Caldimicrobium sp.]|nr:helicase-related protein [Caldimicrobium sp.]MCX7873046.1 helicase-related protein [Caldimicrobium sp.]MDW8094799.1 helicase-related protein [Caldimicrobium sp.]